MTQILLGPNMEMLYVATIANY